MFKIIFVLVLSFFVQSSVYAEHTQRHLVVLVHGVASSPESFGALPEALREQLKIESPQTNWEILTFKYDTGRNDRSIFDFSLDLAKYIKAHLKGNSKTTKVSLIMHSQGGLIGMRMLSEMYKNNPLYFPEIKNQIDAFITLGTPFWGSKIALFASRLKPIFDYLNLPLHDRFGAKELKDLEIASDYGPLFRREMIEFQGEHFAESFKFNSRALIIAGITENLDILAPIGSGKYRFEDDMAVPLPSAHLDFYYYLANGANRTEVKVRDFEFSNVVNDDDYMIINAMHFSPLPESEQFKGISSLPKRCISISYEECDHPIFRPIMNHLLMRAQDPYFKRDLTSFGVDLKINFKNLKINQKDIELKFSSKTKHANIGQIKELYSRVKRWDSAGNLRYFTTGEIDSKKALSKRAEFQLEVLNKGQLLQKIQLPVEITKTTYIELEF